MAAADRHRHLRSGSPVQRTGRSQPLARRDPRLRRRHETDARAALALADRLRQRTRSALLRHRTGREIRARAGVCGEVCAGGVWRGGGGHCGSLKTRDEGRGESKAESLTFALLLAGSPLAIYYSREARPYALLILLATLLLSVFLRPSASPREPVPLIALALLFTTSGSGPLLVASAITAAIAFAMTRRRDFAIYAVSGGVAAALIPILYRRMPPNAASGFRFSARFFQRILQSFSIGAVDITVIHRAAYVVGVLALIGAIVLLQRDRVRGVIVTGMAVLPVAVSLAALWKLRHWYAVRYVATALPAYLLLAAIGIVAILRMIFRGRTAMAIPIAALIAAGFIVREGWTSATTEPYRKLNWRVIAATIHEHAHARDAVVTTNDWSYVCLDFYLRQLPTKVRLISAGESASRAASVVAHNEPVWIVSAGFHRAGDVGDWSCQYPVVLASPLEGFRLHYAPGLQHLLLHRLTPADTRALIARYPTHVMPPRRRQQRLPRRRLVRSRRRSRRACAVDRRRAGVGDADRERCRSPPDAAHDAVRLRRRAAADRNDRAQFSAGRADSR